MDGRSSEDTNDRLAERTEVSDSVVLAPIDHLHDIIPVSSVVQGLFRPSTPSEGRCGAAWAGLSSYEADPVLARQK